MSHLSDLKRGPWWPMSTRPRMKGWYEVQQEPGRRDGRRYWDGRLWRLFVGGPQILFYPSARWRGLALPFPAGGLPWSKVSRKPRRPGVYEVCYVEETEGGKPIAGGPTVLRWNGKEWVHCHGGGITTFGAHDGDIWRERVTA